MGNQEPTRGMRTVAVHAGEPRPPIGDAIVMPIFQSSTYVLGEPQEYDDIRYIRLNNTPNHTAVAEKLAALEGTEAAVVTPSGTSAISMTLLSFLRSGDHLIAQERLYGGTRKVLDHLESHCGIHVTYVAAAAPETWSSAVRANTRIFYVESITNPLLDVAPLDTVVRFAREHGLKTVIDNTFATPVNFRPTDLGFDVIVHSASKYLNGHSDIVAGVVAGEAETIAQVRKTLNVAGVCMDPHACFLLQRGLKTLPVRVRAQNETALILAQALRRHPLVEHVRYPGLPEDPSHGRARAWFSGFGAIVTFVPGGGVEAAERILNRLELPQTAPSLGGVETLVSRAVTTAHAALSKALTHQLGVSEDMIRVSVGLEDAEDLVRDFIQAIEASVNRSPS